MYDILINPDPADDIQCSFSVFLFNQPNHLTQQPCSHLITFYLFHRNKKRADARFSMFIENNVGISPCRATFGSIEICDSLLQEHLDYFIEAINDFAYTQQLQQISIKSYPACYAPEASASISASLLYRGYQVSQTELNYHISISADPFTDLLHLSEKRKLKKCVEKGFIFGEDANPDLPAIYHLIKLSRIRRNFPVSLSYSDFEQLFVRFAGLYKVFTVRDVDKIVAMTVTVRINSNILYNFYPADDPDYRSFSPMVLLMKGLYDYCQQEGIGILDLGIATDGGEPNFGLMRFKQFIGGKPSLKFTFAKSFRIDK